MSVVGLMNVSHAFLATAIGGEISGLIETSGLVAKTVLVILLIFSVALLGHHLLQVGTVPPRPRAE